MVNSLGLILQISIRREVFLKSGEIFENYQWWRSFLSKFTGDKVFRGFSLRFKKTLSTF